MKEYPTARNMTKKTQQELFNPEEHRSKQN